MIKTLFSQTFKLRVSRFSTSELIIVDPHFMNPKHGAINPLLRMTEICNCTVASNNVQTATKLVGPLHTLVLNKIAEDVEFPNLYRERVYNLASELLDQEARKLGVYPLQLPSFKTVDQAADAVVKHLKTIVYQLLKRADITPLQAVLMQEIIHKLVTVPNPAKLNFDLIGYEALLLQRIDMDEWDKATILGVAEIVRHSSVYWSEALKDETDLWHPIVGLTFEYNTVYRAALADALGFLTGMIMAKETTDDLATATYGAVLTSTVVATSFIVGG